MRVLPAAASRYYARPCKTSLFGGTLARCALFFVTGRNVPSSCNENLCYAEVVVGGQKYFVPERTCGAATSLLGMAGEGACPDPGAWRYMQVACGLSSDSPCCRMQPVIAVCSYIVRDSLTPSARRHPASATCSPSPAAIQYGGPGCKCLQPEGGVARRGRITVLRDTGCTHKFVQLPNGALQHAPSGLCLQPYPGETGAPWSPADGVADGTALVFWDNCTSAPAAAFQQAANGAMVHISSGKCLSLQGGAPSPAEGALVVLAEACTQPLQLSAGAFPAPGPRKPAQTAYLLA